MLFIGAIVEDFIVENNDSQKSDLKDIKLLRCRRSNYEFEYDLAIMICGEEENSFPYRTSTQLTGFFQRLDFDFTHDGSIRRYWVKEVLEQLSIKEISLLIRRGLFNKRDFKNYAAKENKVYEDLYENAIIEFQKFIEFSIEENEEIDLGFLLGLNVNTDLLFNKNVTTKDSELDAMISEAKLRFLNKKDKQIALEKIWDAFERLKTYFGKNKKESIEELINVVVTDLETEDLNSEFRALTTLGNRYQIRHFEIDKIAIKSQDEIDYLFFRVLSFIDLCISKLRI